MYYIKIGDADIILSIECKSQDAVVSDDIEISYDEYIAAFSYRKFDKTTRKFYEQVSIQSDVEISDKQRIEQLEETVGILAEQLAKQTLGM